MHSTDFSLEYLTLESFGVVDTQLSGDLNQAYFHLGNLKGKIGNIKNPSLLLMPLVVMESVRSSNIESINSTILDQLQVGITGRSITTPEQKLTQNYKNALLIGFDYIQKNKRFDLELVLMVQKTLLPDSSGIRDNEPVVIANTITGKVLWQPPIGQANLLEYLENWFGFCNSVDGVDELTKVGILHSQFEAIHPFVDGNGRTGRILIILYLIHVGLLDYPCLFISDYILLTRTVYYIALQESQTEKNHLAITKYIVKAILEKSQYNCNIIDRIIELKNFCGSELTSKVPSINSPKLLEYLFQNPFYSIVSICGFMGVSRNTGSAYLTALVKHGIIEVRPSRKNKLFYNPTLLKILS
jgi:Fic family protein